MNCYQHRDSPAVGICKNCNKGLCHECAEDAGNGLACKGLCVDEVRQINTVIERNKRIYGIGTKSVLPPTALLIYFFFAAFFAIWSGFLWYRHGELAFFPAGMALGFGVIGLIAYFRNRKIGISC
ncbi:MAG: hypothetical protein HY954_10320 [Deltaproteobacteria bacterium]|nr:hypothetical protein [Deltaproteobacteria bacterium]